MPANGSGVLCTPVLASLACYVTAMCIRMPSCSEYVMARSRLKRFLGAAIEGKQTVILKSASKRGARARFDESIGLPLHHSQDRRSLLHAFDTAKTSVHT